MVCYMSSKSSIEARKSRKTVISPILHQFFMKKGRFSQNLIMDFKLQKLVLKSTHVYASDKPQFVFLKGCTFNEKTQSISSEK